MTPKERAEKVLIAYNYPELTQLRDLIERAIIAALAETESQLATLRALLVKALPIVAVASVYVDGREVALADEISAALAPPQRAREEGKI